MFANTSSSKERRGGTDLGLQLSAVPLPRLSVGRSTAHACPKRQRVRSETFSTASAASVTRGSALTQTGSQQTAAVTLKDQQGVIPVLVITTIEEAELLLPIRGIVGGIDIEQDRSSFPDLFPTDLHKRIEKGILQLEQVGR